MIGRDPIGEIEHDHACLLRFCDCLECIADGLPGLTDRDLAANSIAVLRHGLTGHSRLEDVLLFPLLRRRAAGVSELSAFLAQLEEEHVQDADFAFELAEELDQLKGAGHFADGNRLGYMLRGFFSSQRRHIEWENAAVLPVARRVLGGEDRAELAFLMDADAVIASSRRTIRIFGVQSAV